MLVLFDVSCIAFFLALVITPWLRNTANRFGFVDLPDASRKLHSGAIPRVGGLGVALAYVLALAFIVVAPYRNLNFDIPRGISLALSLAPAAVIVLGVGLIDDIRGLKPWQKLAGEIVAAVFAYFGGFGVYVLRGQPVSDWLSLPLTVLWLVGCANALNLIDGMDGLAAGVGIFATLTSFIAALVHGSLELAMVTAPLAGALLGFLRYNFNPASIFLGDSGSLLIGFLLGCFGTLWGQKSATVVGMTAPLIALAMPLMDTALAIARRFLRHQPIFAGDHAHIHHKLLEHGFTPRRAALVLYGCCGLAATFSLLQDVAHNEFSGLIIVLFCASAWMGVQHLGYAEFGVASRLFLRGSFRGMVNAQLRMQQFERTLGKAKDVDEAWEAILNGVREFGLCRVQMRIGGCTFDSMPGAELLRTEKSDWWQVRVPLAPGQFINISHDPERDLHPMVLASFPRILRSFLQSRFVVDAPAEAAVVEHAAP
jgi:UDP-GlcNAc:undecaprenyl-phosphate GlcNAc-1-phosphate transferase